MLFFILLEIFKNDDFPYDVFAFYKFIRSRMKIVDEVELFYIDL